MDGTWEDTWIESLRAFGSHDRSCGYDVHPCHCGYEDVRVLASIADEFSETAAERGWNGGLDPFPGPKQVIAWLEFLGFPKGEVTRSFVEIRKRLV